MYYYYAHYLAACMQDYKQDIHINNCCLGSPALNGGQGGYFGSNFVVSTAAPPCPIDPYSAPEALKSAVKTALPQLPPCYTPHPTLTSEDGLPSAYCSRSNYALVCRYTPAGSAHRFPFPVSRFHSSPAASVVPTAPDMDDCDEDDDEGDFVSGGSDVIGRQNRRRAGRHYASVVSWPHGVAVGQCCTRIVHPPPVYTPYATNPPPPLAPTATADVSSVAMTSFPPETSRMYSVKDGPPVDGESV